MITTPHTFKLVVLGDAGVGKTCFIKRHLTGEFEKKYLATQGVEVHPLTFHTNHGEVLFNVWDVAGQDMFRGPCKGYLQNADCAIVMFDVTRRLSNCNAQGWCKIITRNCGSIPVAVCANKVDEKDHSLTFVDPSDFDGRVKYHSVSTKSNFNLEQPFISLMESLIPPIYIELVDGPEINPPGVSEEKKREADERNERQEKFCNEIERLCDKDPFLLMDAIRRYCNEADDCSVPIPVSSLRCLIHVCEAQSEALQKIDERTKNEKKEEEEKRKRNMGRANAITRFVLAEHQLDGAIEDIEDWDCDSSSSYEAEQFRKCRSSLLSAFRKYCEAVKNLDPEAKAYLMARIKKKYNWVDILFYVASLPDNFTHSYEIQSPWCD